MRDIPKQMMVGPLLFSVAVFLGWTFGRGFFCGI